MQVTRKIAAAAAVATVATLGLATVVSANVLDDTQQKAQDTGLADAASLASKAYGNHGWYGVKRDGGLLAIDDNNVGPFQACHLFGSGTGIGGNVPASDVVGVVGFWNNGNSVTAVKTCEQGNTQANQQVVQAWATTGCSRSAATTSARGRPATTSCPRPASAATCR